MRTASYASFKSGVDLPYSESLDTVEHIKTAKVLIRLRGYFRGINIFPRERTLSQLFCFPSENGTTIKEMNLIPFKFAPRGANYSF